MEIYNLYQSLSAVFAVFYGKKITEGQQIIAIVPTDKSVIAALIGAFVVLTALFVLQGVGLYVMAKRRNLTKKWLAFVPFANLYLIGKLTGACSVFGRKMAHAGVFTMVAQLVASALVSFTIYVELVLFVGYGDCIAYNGVSLDWIGLPQNVVWMASYYRNCDMLVSVIGLIYELLLLILVMGLFKKYSPKNYMVLSILSLFIPYARYITIFVVRGNSPVDYEAYMRARQEAFMRRQQQYGNPYNPYGQNPYGQNPYGQNPYGQNAYGQPNAQPQGQKPPEDPFSEFGENSNSSSGSGSGNEGNTSSSDSDGLFD